MLDGADQIGPLGIQPCPRLCVFLEPRRGLLGVGRRERQPQHLRIQQPGGRIDGPQIPLEQSSDGRPAILFEILVTSAFGSVESQQVVKAEPVGTAPAEEVRAGEPVINVDGPE